jgi:hypothetical protein
MAADFVSSMPLTAASVLRVNNLQWNFVANLIKVFPSLANRPLYLTGESYAGRFIVSDSRNKALHEHWLTRVWLALHHEGILLALEGTDEVGEDRNRQRRDRKLGSLPGRSNGGDALSDGITR